MAYEIHGGAAARSRAMTKIRTVACDSIQRITEILWREIMVGR